MKCGVSAVRKSSGGIPLGRFPGNNWKESIQNGNKENSIISIMELNLWKLSGILSLKDKNVCLLFLRRVICPTNDFLE